MKRFYRPFARVLAVAIALTASSAQAEFHTQVVNGHNATPGAWPFMVALIDKEAPSAADGQFCGGSLIGPQHILTAAHCVVSSGGTVADPAVLWLRSGEGISPLAPLSGMR